MARFRYRARTQKGEMQVGFVEAPNREAAAAILTSHELYVLFLEEVGERRWYEFFSDYFARVKTKDLMIFTRQFATLLSAKVPLSDALTTLETQTRNINLRIVVREVIDDVDAGLSLSQALEKYNQIFSDFYVNMVRAAEITGRIEEAVNYLADYIDKQTILTSRIRNALIYPAIVVGLFILVGGIMVSVVFPQIQPIFTEAGVKLPIFTKILLAAGSFLAHWWWAIFIIIIFLGIFAYDYLRTPEGKIFRDEIILRIPVLRNLLKEVYLARFSETLSVLIKGGIPIAQAIEITGHTVGSATYRDNLHQAAIEVTRGETLSQALSKRDDLFPPLVSQMIAIGESTGRLEELLERISQFYTREADDLINNLVELIQPLLLAVIGLLVGGLFASILIPIYELARSF